MTNEPPMEKGLPLGFALRRWTHPRLIAKLDELDARAAEQPDNLQLKEEANAFRAKLERDLINRFLVRSNQFWLTGYLDPVTPKSQRGEISWDVTRDIHCWNFDASEGWFKATGCDQLDMHIVRIEVLGPIPQWEIARSTGAPSTPLERTEAIPIYLSDDNATLTISGKTFIIRGQKQQLILRQLVEAYKSGSKLRTETVLRKAGANADSIRKVFNKSPHWPALKGILRQQQGHCWFDQAA
jgi:hypothetical protein